MLFNSFDFLIFFPIVTLCYYLIPSKYRYLWILLSSYYFYLCWNIRYGLILLGITILTYTAALLMDSDSRCKVLDCIGKHRKCVLILTVVMSFCVLGAFL